MADTPPVGPTEQLILRALEEHGPLDEIQLVSFTGLPPSLSRQHLAHLIDARLIRRSEGTPRPKRPTYELNEGELHEAVERLVKKIVGFRAG